MNWLSGLFIYALIWWIVLFAVLPWGVRHAQKPEPGHDAGAPSNPRLWLKLLATSILALLLWVAVFYIMEAGLISFRPDLATPS